MITRRSGTAVDPAQRQEKHRGHRHESRQNRNLSLRHRATGLPFEFVILHEIRVKTFTRSASNRSGFRPVVVAASRRLAALVPTPALSKGRTRGIEAALSIAPDSPTAPLIHTSAFAARWSCARSIDAVPPPLSPQTAPAGIGDE
jgi:hypothetical protein